MKFSKKKIPCPKKFRSGRPTSNFSTKFEHYTFMYIIIMLSNIDNLHTYKIWLQTRKITSTDPKKKYEIEIHWKRIQNDHRGLFEQMKSLNLINNKNSFYRANSRSKTQERSEYGKEKVNPKIFSYSRGPLILCTSYIVMFPLFCTIFRFWNYKIRGTYYAFRIEIPKFWDSRYRRCT